MPHPNEENVTKQHHDSSEIDSFGSYEIQVIFEFFIFLGFRAIHQRFQGQTVGES